MRHGSLFSGIGGFDLAAEWMGWENVFHCEINKFCQKILKQHWPDTKLYEDITTTDFTEWKGRCDIVTGGFPCQPFSVAGDRKGQDDDRFLWKEMLRAITEIKPRWIVAENVYGLLNIDNGITADLSVPIWKIAGIRSRSFLIVRLTNLDYQQWNGICGLFQRPLASDSKGAKTSRTRTKEMKGNFREQIREDITDGIYPKPNFVMWVKGFPENWLQISEMD